jgi:putative N-acetyltransferase (TIGR04045 family)
MYPASLEPFVPPQFGIKLASERWERDASAALRRHVFCREQALFECSDRDAADPVAQTIVAVDYVMGMTHRVVGTVRIHEQTPGTWYGSRLAIDPDYRGVYGLGRGLVFRAVCTAHARGCRLFLAHVQVQNVKFFERMAWGACSELVLYGRPHVLMQADLAAYPPAADDAAVALVTVRRAS